MPSKSKAQQSFMGMVAQCQKGGKCTSAAVERAAKTMKKKDVLDFAKTKHKGLPKRVDEMAKGGNRLKNMGKKATGKDVRVTPGRNIVASANTNRGGAMKNKKTDYKRKAKNNKVYEGVSFKEFLILEAELEAADK